MRPGARLGIDVGAVRVGVAVCDPDGLLATPVETVPRDKATVGRVAALAAEHAAIEVVVGLPLSLSGEEGSAAEAARTRTSGASAARAGCATVSIHDHT